VSAGFAVGGLVGIDNGSVSNSFWDSDLFAGPYAGGVPGNPVNVTVTGLTTAQSMQLVATTAALGATGQITDTGGTTGMTWRIYEGQTTPLLMRFLKPLTVTADPVSKTFDGLTYSGGLVNPVYSPPAPDLTHVLGTAQAYGPNAINAGTYNPALYSDQLGYDLSFVGGVLTVTPAGLNLLSVTADPAGKIFGNTHTFAGTEFTPVGLVGGDTISGVTLNSAGAVASANVGTYAIIPSNAVFSVGSASNYDITYVNGVLTVTPRAISISASAASKVYGSADPNLFTVGGLGLASFDTNSTAFTGSLSHGGGENVGTGYAITQGTLAANSNYTVTGFTGSTLDITPASLSVAAADNAGKIFGNTHTFAGTEFTPVGLVGSDTISGVTLTSTGAAATANVGAYAIIPSNAVFSIGSASNYSITYVNGVLTIIPKGLSVAAADNAGKIFGNTHTFAGTEFTPVGLVGSDTISGVTLTSTGAAATANVGAYAIIPSNAVFSIGSASNYSITYVNGVLTITPASPTVVQEIAAISLGTRTPEGESRDEDREDVLAWMEGEGDQGDGLPDNLPVCR